MIRIVFVLAQVFTASAFAAQNPAWPKAMVNDLKTKTLQQTFCENSPGFETKAACDFFGKDKKALSQKLVSVSVNGAVLTLNDGKRTVEIKRLNDDLQFEINKKIIDVREYRQPAQLFAAIEKALPKVATRSLWLNSANAEEIDSPVYTLMARASGWATLNAIDDSACSSIDDFIKACEVNINSETELGKYKDGLLKPAQKLIDDKELNDWEFRTAIADLDVIAVKVHKMKSLTFGLINRSREANNYCKQKGWPDIADKMDQCLAVLKDTAETLKRFRCKNHGIDQKTCEETTVAFGRKLDLQEEKQNKIVPKSSSQSNPSVR